MAMATPLVFPLHLSLVRSHRSRFPLFFTRSPSLNQFSNRVSSASSDGTGASPISTSAAPAIQSQSRDSKSLDTDSTSSSSVAVHALTFQQAVQRLQVCGSPDFKLFVLNKRFPIGQFGLYLTIPRIVWIIVINEKKSEMWHQSWIFMSTCIFFVLINLSIVVTKFCFSSNIAIFFYLFNQYLK